MSPTAEFCHFFAPMDIICHLSPRRFVTDSLLFALTHRRPSAMGGQSAQVIPVGLLRQSVIPGRPCSSFSVSMASPPSLGQLPVPRGTFTLRTHLRQFLMPCPPNVLAIITPQNLVGHFTHDHTNHLPYVKVNVKPHV